MKIYNRFTQKVIFESKDKTMKKTVLKAIKKGAGLSEADLKGADLSEADLKGADLCNCYFNKTKISFRGKTVYVDVRDTIGKKR